MKRFRNETSLLTNMFGQFLLKFLNVVTHLCAMWLKRKYNVGFAYIYILITALFNYKVG